MQDFYLKFTDEAEAQSVLYTKVPTAWDDEGEPTEWYDKPNFANIDTIGVIYEPQEDPDVEPVPYDGWFVNVRVVGEDAAPLEPFSIDPQPYPMRIWG